MWHNIIIFYISQRFQWLCIMWKMNDLYWVCDLFSSLFMLIQKFHKRSSSFSICSSNYGPRILNGRSSYWRVWYDDVIKWKHFPRYWPFVRGNSPAPSEFPTQRPVTRSFDVFFDLGLNKRLSKQSWGWWFETLSRSLWCHRNGKVTYQVTIGNVLGKIDRY